MEYTYAALLLNNTKQEINEANLKKVLTAAGVTTVDELKIKGIVAALQGVNIEEAVKQAAVVTAAPAAAGAAPKEAAKEEKTEEKKEEEAAAGLASLFG